MKIKCRKLYEKQRRHYKTTLTTTEILIPENRWISNIYNLWIENLLTHVSLYNIYHIEKNKINVIFCEFYDAKEEWTYEQ